jgi:hypothetical protein
MLSGPERSRRTKYDAGQHTLLIYQSLFDKLRVTTNSAKLEIPTRYSGPFQMLVDDLDGLLNLLHHLAAIFVVGG